MFVAGLTKTISKGSFALDSNDFILIYHREFAP